MKALSLARPLLIFVIGLPGAGKSFFARHFSETFNAPLVSSDELQFELFSSPKFTAMEYGLIKRLAERQLVQLIKTGGSIVVDGLCNTRQERQSLQKLATAHTYHTLVVWVQTDEPTAMARSLNRNKKRAGDERNVKVTAAQFQNLAKRVVPPLKTEDFIVISGKHAYSTQAKMVLRKLAAPRAQKAAVAHQKETEQVRARPPLPAPRRVSNPGRRNVIIR